MDSHNDERVLREWIAARLPATRPAPDREAALRQGVFERVGRSVLAHREYTTVRREDGDWRAGPDGVTSRLLHRDESTLVSILRLARGAELPWHETATAQEILILDGAVASTGSPASDGSGPHAFRVRHRSEAEAALHASTDATVYVRQVLVDIDRLPTLEAHWWRLARRPSTWIQPSRKRWLRTADGVQVLPLCGDAQVVSMLVRFGAGASVADHRHALDEDCLVLEGEMFLGDILLRAGDYQLAPAGGSHFGEMSDVGVLFFFHGALDPVLRGERAANAP